MRNSTGGRYNAYPGEREAPRRQPQHHHNTNIPPRDVSTVEASSEPDRDSLPLQIGSDSVTPATRHNLAVERINGSSTCSSRGFFVGGAFGYHMGYVCSASNAPPSGAAPCSSSTLGSVEAAWAGALPGAAEELGIHTAAAPARANHGDKLAPAGDATREHNTKQVRGYQEAQAKIETADGIVSGAVRARWT